MMYLNFCFLYPSYYIFRLKVITLKQRQLLRDVIQEFYVLLFSPHRIFIYIHIHILILCILVHIHTHIHVLVPYDHVIAVDDNIHTSRWNFRQIKYTRNSKNYKPIPAPLAIHLPPFIHTFSPNIMAANKAIHSKFIQPNATISRKYCQQHPRQYNP